MTLFSWKVSAEQDYDFLRFSISGSQQAGISGGVGWQQSAHSVAVGLQVLRWEYTNDNTLVRGANAGWVDQIVWTVQYPVLVRRSPKVLDSFLRANPAFQMFS